MARYIDADELFYEIQRLGVTISGRDVFSEAKDDILRIIDECPTADVEPVIYGKWEDKHHIIPLDNVTLTGTYPTCSLCGYAEVGMTKHTNFCPNCGAEMEGTK